MTFHRNGPGYRKKGRKKTQPIYRVKFGPPDTERSLLLSGAELDNCDKCLRHRLADGQLANLFSK